MLSVNGIAVSRYLTLFTCILLILLIQSVNGAQLLNITFLFLLFASASATKVTGTAIILLTSKQICMHNYNQINWTLSL